MSGRALIAGLVLLAAGCGINGPVEETTGAEGLSPETFVTVFIELRRALQEATAPEEFAARRREILERHGVTEDEILRYAELRGGDVGAMTELWDTIRARMNTADSTTGAR